MFSMKIINIIILFLLLWMLVNSQAVDKELDDTLNEQMKYQTPTNDDQREFNSQWDTLMAARSLTDEEQKRSAIRVFRNFRNRRESLMRRINTLLRTSAVKRNSAIESALMTALNEGNNFKEVILNWAREVLGAENGFNAGANTGQNNGSSPSGPSGSSTLPGGVILFTPTFLNEIYNSSPSEGNSNNKIANILEKLLGKLELFVNGSDEDWFNLFSWR